MKRVLKWIGIVVASLLGLVILIALGLYAKARLEFGRTYNLQVESVTIPTDAPSIQRGQHLATFLCMECHGKDLGGNPAWFDAGPIGGASTPNLTTGQGGLGSQLTDVDFVRVLRHGVKPNGMSVFIMPANDFRFMSDQDLGALIAYVRSVPPVDRPTPLGTLHFTFLGNVLYGAGMFGNVLRASQIDQTSPPPAAPQPGVTADYGQYLVDINGCRDCHSAQLSGGKTGTPGSPLAPNLTPGGELSAWTEADFLNTLQTGVTPSGTHLPPQFMPWDFKGQMTPDELRAVWAYLHSLPALKTTTAPSG
jgi:mono/diheme cytochrome c family protein